MKTFDRGDVYPQSKENEITVFSWNLLAPTHDRSGLDWKTVRAPALREWLKRFAACDVLCFQEVDIHHSLSDIDECLKTYGFTGIVQERQGFPVVNATFFKTSRLQVTSTQHRSRALLVNCLSTTGQEICVVNVHLDSLNEDQRRSQLASALRRMQGSDISIVCGDFNSSISAGSPIQKQLAEAGLFRAPTRGITHTYGVSIDHIWASECLVPIRILSSSNDSLTSIRTSGIPNMTHPSDHLPVAASFRLPSRVLEENSSILGLQVPTSLDPNIREEWQSILRIGSFCNGKVATREQKKLEAAFLSAVSQEEATALRDWQKSAAVAAQALIRDAVRQASASFLFAKPHDPGKPDLPGLHKTFGGA